MNLNISLYDIYICIIYVCVFLILVQDLNKSPGIRLNNKNDFKNDNENDADS